MRGCLAFGLLVLLAGALAFPGVVLRGEVLFERDLHQMLYGQYASIARIVRAGSWPTWDPWPGFGQPLLANPAAQVLYPPTWLCLAFAPPRAYVAYLFLHLGIGAFATRALARRLGASDTAAAGAALLWMLSGPLLSLANLWHHLAGASLMPVVWLAAASLRREPSPRRALLLGGAIGLQLLAGSFDTVALTLVVVAGWWLSAGREGSSATASLPRQLLALALAAFVASALAAGLLLPLLEVWRGSPRMALGEGMRTQWSLHPGLLLQFALPLLAQRLSLTPDARAQLFDGREPFLASVYLGLAAVPLVAAAFLPRPRRPALFLAGAFSFFALVALGRHGVLYPALAGAIPALQSLRYPSKAAVVLPLLWALLAARGLDAVRDRSGRALRPVLALGAVAIVAAVLASVVLRAAPPPWTLSPGRGGDGAALAAAARGLQVAAFLGMAVLFLLRREGAWAGRVPALLVLAGLDLGLAHRDLNESAPFRLFQPPPAILSHLDPSASTRLHTWDYMSRVLGKTYRRAEVRIPVSDAPPDVSPTLAGALARRDFLSPPIGAEFALRGSFDRDWLGLAPRGVRNLGLFFQAKEETPEILRLLQVGGVSEVVALHKEGLESLSLVATVASPFAGPVHLLRVPDPLPRAFAVGGTRVADGLPALQLLADASFDPRREVLLPGGPQVPAPEPFPATVSLVQALPDRIAADVLLPADGHVVLLEAWDEGWRASVDGAPAPTRRANVGFVAVPVPRGAHRVLVVHRPRGLVLGLLATTSAAALVLGAWAAGLLRSRRQAPRA